MVFAEGPLLEFLEIFLQAEETSIQKGRRYDRKALPYPWGEVSYFKLRYITCKGYFIVLFKYHFKLLVSLQFRHVQIHSLNISFFL